MPGSTQTPTDCRADRCRRRCRALVHRQPDAVSGAVHEIVCQPASASASRRGASTCSAVTPGRTASTATCCARWRIGPVRPLRNWAHPGCGSGSSRSCSGLRTDRRCRLTTMSPAAFTVRNLMVRVGTVRTRPDDDERRRRMPLGHNGAPCRRPPRIRSAELGNPGGGIAPVDRGAGLCQCVDLRRIMIIRSVHRHRR